LASQVQDCSVRDSHISSGVSPEGAVDLKVESVVKESEVLVQGDEASHVAEKVVVVRMMVVVQRVNLQLCFCLSL